jgi:stress-induced morphogen
LIDYLNAAPGRQRAQRGVVVFDVPFARMPAMPMRADEIERLIKAKLPDAEVTIKDLAGDGDHYQAHVVSAAFKGLSRIRQHQLVYEAFGGQMGNVLHALALTTEAKAA